MLEIIFKNYATDVVESLSYNKDYIAIPSEIFKETCEVSHTLGYWLGSASGQYITFDLRTTEMIWKVHLRNSHNSISYDRATMRFNLDISNDTVTWITAVDKNLVNTLSPRLACEDIPNQSFAVEQVARFVRFKAVTQYGSSPGLNYIKFL